MLYVIIINSTDVNVCKWCQTVEFYIVMTYILSVLQLMMQTQETFENET